MTRIRSPVSTLASFARWHQGSSDRLQIALVPWTASRQHLSMRFDLPADGLFISLVGDDLSIMVHPPGNPDDLWDIIRDFQATPAAVSDHWICRLCGEGVQTPLTYPSRDALLRDHVFEPFLTRVNQDLTQADAVGLYRDDGVTWAKLIRGEASNAESHQPVHRIPLR